MARPKLIGIDTGGTYTDAVLYDESAGVLAKAKALTTRPDLSLGIGAAIRAVLTESGVSSDQIGMVALSTTLATNAIVEGLGDRIGLVLVGFTESDLDRAGLRSALAGDPVLFLPGGHDAHGGEVQALDLHPMTEWLGKTGGPQAFAVAGQFSVANPAHELAVRDRLVAQTGRPVTCSHELSAGLNAPRRALTSVLNARLIGIIHHLLDATSGLLAELAITAPIMVVKGDGSLISGAEARRKPIETILSGPAASLVGASFLTGLPDAMVADIGGTTTDVARLKSGRPRLDPSGARVGGWSTMVEAVAMHTVGLGGDSDIQPDPDHHGLLRLGPRRVVPVSLLASRYGETIHRALDRQLASPTPVEHGGRFALAGPATAPRPDDAMWAELLDAVAGGPVPLDKLLSTRRHRVALERLLARGAVQVAAFCPSDAAHVIGIHQGWDRSAAEKAAELFARNRNPKGDALAADGETASRLAIDALIKRTAEILLDTAFAEEGSTIPAPSSHPLMQLALAQALTPENTTLVRLGVKLDTPVIALGASAHAYYPGVARLLRTEAVIPEHAEVANAIGAVVGHVRIVASVKISRPADGVYRAHAETGPRDFGELAEATTFAEQALRSDVSRKAEASGAATLDITLERHETAVALDGGQLFLELTIMGTGVGRPALG